jgi:Protein of unknown function (DUF3126)
MATPVAGRPWPARIASTKIGGPGLRAWDLLGTGAEETEAVTPAEMAKLKKYFSKLFNTPTVDVRRRGKLTDSAEVYVNGDCVGIVSDDDEDGDKSFALNISILEFDLEDHS